MKKEIYIANGKHFNSYEDVVNYAASINCRVANTQTIKRNVYLITLNALDNE